MFRVRTFANHVFQNHCLQNSFANIANTGGAGSFKFVEKSFKSISIDIGGETCKDSNEFSLKLSNTIENAKKSKYTSIMLNIDLPQSTYIPIAG